MVRTVPREFDWSACPPGHQAPDADHNITIRGPSGKPKRCTCLADAKALADHPENNRPGIPVGPRVPGPAERRPDPAPREPGPATRRDPVKPKASTPKRKGSTKKQS